MSHLSSFTDCRFFEKNTNTSPVIGDIGDSDMTRLNSESMPLRMLTGCWHMKYRVLLSSPNMMMPLPSVTDIQSAD